MQSLLGFDCLLSDDDFRVAIKIWTARPQPNIFGSAQEESNFWQWGLDEGHFSLVVQDKVSRFKVQRQYASVLINLFQKLA
jgi:hypothetical protein